MEPPAAGRLRPNDQQRGGRALEGYFKTRRGLSDLIREAPFGPDRHPAIRIGLDMERTALFRRIDERVVRFFASGLVDEVRALLRAGCPDTANAFKALGYKEALLHLRGQLTLEEAISLTQRNTRRYAKRQWTWFRREKDVSWFDLDPSCASPFREPLAHAARALGFGASRC